MTDQQYEAIKAQHAEGRYAAIRDELRRRSLELFRQKIGLTHGGGTSVRHTPCRPPARDLVTAATELMKRYPATHYFTLTYQWPNCVWRREDGLRGWLDAVEWLQRTPLGVLWATENSPNFWTGCGMPGNPVHHHGVLFGTPNLSTRFAEELWQQEYGDALVLRFEAGRGAIPYVLKQAFGRSGGDWGIAGRFDKIRPHVLQSCPSGRSPASGHLGF